MNIEHRKLITLMLQEISYFADIGLLDPEVAKNLQKELFEKYLQSVTVEETKKMKSAKNTSHIGLIPILGCTNVNRSGDVIFIHGLGGNARSTWHPKGMQDDDEFWPVWLGSDRPELGIWSLGYEVEPFAWKGSTMPLVDRATHTLALMETDDIGKRPVLFITHSMGGLLIKQMLRHAHDFGSQEWKTIVEQTRGIVFLSTPHSGADIANWVRHIRKLVQLTVSVEELEANHPRLRELNQLYRNNEKLKNIKMQVYCEKKQINGILVVDETSADPSIPGVIPIPMDEDHISICRPQSKESLIYRRTKRFIEDCLELSSQPLDYGQAVVIGQQVEEAVKQDPEIRQAVEAVANEAQSHLTKTITEPWQGINIKGGTNTMSGNTFQF